MKAGTSQLVALMAPVALAAVLVCAPARSALGASTPKAITVGTLYAKSGFLANESIPEYKGLRFWAKHVNENGGVYVKAYGRKLPVKIIAYNDRSSTDLAGTLYNRLVTQDKVDVLVGGFGSIMTSVGVPIAQEHKVLLFDQLGTSEKFFTGDNPYIVDTDLQPTQLWAPPLNHLLEMAGSKRIAILYDTNDFTQPIAETLKKELAARGLTPVYFHGVSTKTSTYQVLLHRINAAHPDAVVELGYSNNDIGFLKAVASNGDHYPVLATIFPGFQPDRLVSNVGAGALDHTFSYIVPPKLVYRHVNFGMTAPQFVSAFRKAMGTGTTVDFGVAAGYNTGLVIQKALGRAKSLRAKDMRRAVYSSSGHLRTLLGTFRLNMDGAQVGERMSIAEMFKEGHGIRFMPVYPPAVAKGKPEFLQH